MVSNWPILRPNWNIHLKNVNVIMTYKSCRAVFPLKKSKVSYYPLPSNKPHLTYFFKFNFSPIQQSWHPTHQTIHTIMTVMKTAKTRHGYQRQTCQYIPFKVNYQFPFWIILPKICVIRPIFILHVSYHFYSGQSPAITKFKYPNATFLWWKENDTFSWDISPIKRLHTESDVDDEQPGKHFATSTQVLPQNNQQEQNNSQASQSLVINQQYNLSYI